MEDSLIKWLVRVYLAQLVALDVGQQIMILQQVSEWAVMSYMVAYQKGKTLGEITFEMNNPSSRNAYRRREAVILYSFHFLILLLIAFNVCLYLNYIDIISNKKYKNFFDYFGSGFDSF